MSGLLTLKINAIVKLPLLSFRTTLTFFGGVCLCVFNSLVSVVRGQVVTSDGTPLIGVNVSLLHHPQQGYTITRQDGMYVQICCTHTQTSTYVYTHNYANTYP